MRLAIKEYGDPDTPEVWKQVGIGGGDVGSILGVSPYKTAYELWEIKTGRKPKPDLSGLYQIEQGNRLEIVARKNYELLTGMFLSPAFYIHDERNWMKAALDGITIGGDHFIEIKFVGKDSFEAALNGSIPDHYRLQCLHYYLVTDAKSCDYVACNSEGEIAIVGVEKDLELMDNLLAAELDFYEHIIKDLEPGKTADDVDDLSGNNEFVMLMAEYNLRKADHDKAKKELDRVKAELIKFAEDRSVMCGEGKVTRYYRQGSLDKEKFLKDTGADCPESYRKKGNWQYKITLNKESE